VGGLVSANLSGDPNEYIRLGETAVRNPILKWIDYIGQENKINFLLPLLLKLQIICGFIGEKFFKPENILTKRRIS
jgi:hypothetical protein